MTIIRGTELDPIKTSDYSIVEYRRSNGTMGRFRFQVFVPDDTIGGMERPKMYSEQEWKEKIHPLVRQTLEKTAALGITTLTPHAKREYRITPTEILTQTGPTTPPQKIEDPSLTSSLGEFIQSVAQSGSFVPLRNSFGIKNEGNTCFLAAALQLILSNPELTHRILTTEDARLKQLREFLRNASQQPSYIGSISGVGAVRSTLEALKGAAEDDWTKGQHDSAEAYKLILEGVYQTSPPNYFSFNLTEGSGTEQQDLEKARAKAAKAAEAADQAADKEDAQKALAAALRDVTFAENRAEKPVPKTADISAEEFQHQLGVFLESSEGSAWQTTPPDYFNIGRQKDSELKGVPSNLEILDKKYSLIGFSCHLGATRTSGHYVAYRKIEDKFYKFDDDRVNEITQEVFLQEARKASNFLYLAE